MKRLCPDADDASGEVDAFALPVPLPRAPVATGKLHGRFARDANGKAMKWPTKPGHTRINVCSCTTGTMRQLSPMLLGPVVLAEHVDAATLARDESQRLGGVALPASASNLENLWQYGKVWSGDIAEGSGAPSAGFFRRRAAGWTKAKADRHALADPSRKGSAQCRRTQETRYHYWFGQYLGYVEARRRVYAPLYERLVRETDAWKELEARVARGEKLLLIGYDAYDREDRSWDECFANEKRPFGHEMVLACMLENQRPFPWESAEQDA